MTFITVLGVDPALGSTGLAVIDNSEQLITTGVVKTRSGDSWPVRWEKITTEVLRSAAGCDDVWVEDVFQGPSPKTTVALAKLSGSIITVLNRNGMDPGMVYPHTWKGHFNLGGQKQYIDMAEKRWPGWPFTSEDECAAAWVALYGLHRFRAACLDGPDRVTQ